MHIKGILFDFGGTIDTDGVHWSEKFWEGYQSTGIMISKKEYEEAYVYAGESMLEGIVKPSDSFRSTIGHQIRLQMQYLADHNKISEDRIEKYAKAVSSFCYADVILTIQKAAVLLDRLSKTYTLVLVSNYYGNIAQVLTEFNINHFFIEVIDSALVGIRKPDPAIWQLGIDALQITPQECLVVGDSYSRDILPAKQLGCVTAWIDGKSYTKPADTTGADYILNTIHSLINVLY